MAFPLIAAAWGLAEFAFKRGCKVIDMCVANRVSEDFDRLVSEHDPDAHNGM